MKRAVFACLCSAWLADIALLAALGPPGRHPWLSGGLYAAGFVLLVLMLRGFPPGISASRAYVLIFALGLAARLLFLPYPAGTDIFRYIWEGLVQNHGFNPYRLAPDSPLLTHLAEGAGSAVREGINHPWLTAIYPPAAMLLFRLLSAVSPSVLLFKAVFAAVDVGVMALLAAMIRMRRLPAPRLLLYAANPLVVVFIGGEGHLEVLQVFFLCLGAWWLLRGGTLRGWIALGLAVVSKYTAGAALPFFWRPPWSWRQLAVFLPLSLYIPFLSAGAGIFNTLWVFGLDMHYNDGIGDVLRRLLGGWSPAVAAGLLALWLVWVWLAEDDPWHGAFLAVGGLLLLLPTLHPWYLVLAAPFLCFFPSRAWLYLQAAMAFTFPVMAGEFETGVFAEIPWLKLPEYLPFFALLAWGRFRSGWLEEVPAARPPETVSVLVPCLNEAGCLERCLKSLEGQPRIREVIVADGGSSDGSAAIAAGLGARVVRAGRGRGVQLRAAAAVAGGDVLLVLHADAVLEPGAVDRLLDALARDPGIAGGCFGMRFDEAGLLQRWIAALNNLRAAAVGIAFGDQAQFVRAEALERIGGFPGLMLMEDVELSLRMKQEGRSVYLGRAVTVSGRRWRRRSFSKNLATVARLFFGYLLRRRLGLAQGACEAYYRRYYQNHS